MSDNLLHLELRLQALRCDLVALLDGVDSAINNMQNSRLLPESGVELAIAIASSSFECTRKALLSRARPMQLCQFRWALMLGCKDVLGMNHSQIGRTLGFSHGSVIHGIRSLRHDMSQSINLRVVVTAYLDKLRAMWKRKTDSVTCGLQVIESASPLDERINNGTHVPCGVDSATMTDSNASKKRRGREVS